MEIFDPAPLVLQTAVTTLLSARFQGSYCFPVEGCRMLSSRLCHARSKNDNVFWWECYMKWNGLSTNCTKHDHTGYTASTPTTGTPLSQSDALVAYKNAKQEKNCGGNRNGWGIKCDINVCRVWYNGILWVCRPSEAQRSCPHWHWMVAMECNGSEDFTMILASKFRICQ